MARIVFAWEMGSGMGHIRYVSELAVRLSRGGHDVMCVVRSLDLADRILSRHSIPVFQAPLLPKPASAPSTTLNYAEVLMGVGYLVDNGLPGACKAWRNLFGLLKPDLLVANHSPTALIAARGLPMKVVHFGTGFAVPPRPSPMPGLIPWIESDSDRSVRSEERVMRGVNVVLQMHGQEPICKLSEIFQVDQEILTTFQELDHYPGREPTRYWGPIFSQAKGGEPAWPKNIPGRKKLFCYMKYSHPLFSSTISALKSLDAEKLVFAVGASASVLSKLETPDMKFSKAPLDLKSTCRESDLVICHAGHGTIAAALLQGTPMVLLPGRTHLEQQVNSRNVERLGAGKFIRPDAGSADIETCVERVMTMPEYASSALAFADKYREFDEESQLQEITRCCETVLE